MELETSLLAGVRVVELATMVFAPSACAALADFGAEIIKVEPPGTGDLNRHYHKLPGMPESALPYTFQIDNRSKKSIALDVKSAAGYDAVRKLIATADVFVTNYRPTALTRLRLTDDDLRPSFPRLIYALGTGYGETGPECDKPGYDSVCYWTRSGIESTIFPLDSWIGPFPFGAGDHPSGISLCAAIMMGLYQRDRTGRGCKVSTSLLANGAWANATMLQAQLCNARFGEPRRREHSYNFTYIHYKAGDGRLLKLCIVNALKDWAPFCRAIGRESLIEDPRFAALEQRVTNMEALIGAIDVAFAERDMEHWITTLTAFDIPFAVLPTYPEIAVDPQLRANGVVVPLDHPTHGPIQTVSSPFEVEGFAKSPATAAPELGQHTSEVLSELGFDEAGIRQFLTAGIAEQFTPAGKAHRVKN